MWILPADLSGLHVSLTAGPHLLPWHYTEDELDRLAWLLRLTLKGIDGELRLDDATLKLLSDRKVTAPSSLVVAVLRDESPDTAEISERVAALGAACALLQLPEPEEAGYGWLEREVKAPLYRAMSGWVKRPLHPLSAFNVQALPVMEAAGLTTDPVELVEILERALAHRLRYADVGCEEGDYRRSLLQSAGERLARRLKRLDGGSHPQSEQLRAALELLLSGGRDVEDRGRHRLGAQALERIGLARYGAGELRLGPLARQATESLSLGALESELPDYAWSEPSRARLAAILREQGSSVPIALLGSSGGTTPSMVDVPPPIELLSRFEIGARGDPDVDTLADLGTVPMYVAEIPGALKQRLVEALRDTEVQAGRSSPRGEKGRVLWNLLELWSARGREALATQEDALRALARWAPEQVTAVAGLRGATLLLRFQRRWEDLDRAESLARHYLDVARRFPAEEGSLDVMAHLSLADVALRREDPDRARDFADKALQAARQGSDRRSLGAALLALARAADEQKRYVEAEQHAREALALFEATSDAGSLGAALRIVTSILLDRHGIRLFSMPEAVAEALELGERALAEAEKIGDIEGRIESLLILGTVALYEEKKNRSWELIQRAASLIDDAVSPALHADTYEAIAVSFSLRGDRDQAIQWARRALAIYEDLGRRSSADRMRRLIANQTKT